MAIGGPYCAITDIEDLLSTNGVSLQIDDAPPSAYGRAIDKAGNQIEKYLYATFDPAFLVESTLVTDWAAAIAATYLCQRRGNPVPQGIAAMHDEAIEDLKAVGKGWREIPGVPRRKGFAPGVSKMRSTLRPYPRAVVESSLGTHATGGGQNFYQQQDPWDAYGFNDSGYLDYSF